MPRIITVSDDDIGIEATVHVEKRENAQESIITRIEIASLCEGGIQSRDLLILEELGLNLPIVDMEPVAVREVDPSPSLPDPLPGMPQEQAESPPLAVGNLNYEVGKGGRVYRERPSLQEITLLWGQLGKSQKRMADHYGIPPHVVARWISFFRKKGYDFPGPNTIPPV